MSTMLRALSVREKENSNKKYKVSFLMLHPFDKHWNTLAFGKKLESKEEYVKAHIGTFNVIITSEHCKNIAKYEKILFFNK